MIAISIVGREQEKVLSWVPNRTPGDKKTCVVVCCVSRIHATKTTAV